MTKWHAHVVDMAKHMNMVGDPFLVGNPGPGPLGPLLKSGDGWMHKNLLSIFKSKYFLQIFWAGYAMGSQLQNYKASRLNSRVKHSQSYNTAVHNCNIKLRECLVE